MWVLSGLTIIGVKEENVADAKKCEVVLTIQK
jgi:hypothetical protein